MGNTQRVTSYWRPDVIEILTAITVIAALLVLDPGTSEASGTALKISIAGAGVLLARAVLRRKNAVEVEKEWLKEWNEFSDEIRPFIAEFEVAYKSCRDANPSLPATWRKLAEKAPWPDVGEEPLTEWESYLRSDAPESARQLYDVAYRIGTLPEIERFRSKAVRVIALVGEHVQQVRDFRHFVDRHGLNNDFFRDLHTVVAYLEFAQAIRIGSTASGNSRYGLWELGRRWHPVTMELPR